MLFVFLILKQHDKHAMYWQFLHIFVTMQQYAESIIAKVSAEGISYRMCPAGTVLPSLPETGVARGHSHHLNWIPTVTHRYKALISSVIITP